MTQASAPEGAAGLLAAIHAELEALDTGDAARIEAATAAKLMALDQLRGEAAAGFPPASAMVMAARDLNALAGQRAARLAASVDRRLACLAASAGRPEPLCYAADGRRG